MSPKKLTEAAEVGAELARTLRPGDRPENGGVAGRGAGGGDARPALDPAPRALPRPVARRGYLFGPTRGRAPPHAPVATRTQGLRRGLNPSGCGRALDSGHALPSPVRSHALSSAVAVHPPRRGRGAGEPASVGASGRASAIPSCDSRANRSRARPRRSAGGRVSEGIARLTRDALLDALATAVMQTARRAGVIAERIEALLPHETSSWPRRWWTAVAPRSRAPRRGDRYAGPWRASPRVPAGGSARPPGPRGLASARRGPFELLAAALGGWRDVLRRAKSGGRCRRAPAHGLPAPMVAHRGHRRHRRGHARLAGRQAPGHPRGASARGGRDLRARTCARPMPCSAAISRARPTRSGGAGRSVIASAATRAAAVARATRHAEACLALAANVERRKLGPEDEAVLAEQAAAGPTGGGAASCRPRIWRWTSATSTAAVRRSRRGSGRRSPRPRPARRPPGPLRSTSPMR